MGSGYPDYLTWSGRAGGGEAVIAFSFRVGVPSDTTLIFDMDAVPVGQEYNFQCVAISCPDDSAIHKIELVRTSDLWIFFTVNFITGGIFDFPGQSFEAGKIIRVKITNMSSSELTFDGALFYTARSV